MSKLDCGDVHLTLTHIFFVLGRDHFSHSLLFADEDLRLSLPSSLHTIRNIGVLLRNSNLLLQSVFLMLELFYPILHHQFLNKSRYRLGMGFTYFDLALLNHDLLFEFVGGGSARQFALVGSYYYLVQVERTKTKVMGIDIGFVITTIIRHA